MDQALREDINNPDGYAYNLTFFVYDIAIITITAPTSQGMVQTY